MQSHGLNIGGVVSIEVGIIGQPATNTLVFPLNPDQSFSHNLRTTVTQTVGGIFVDRFGAGIPMVTLSGGTAWDSPQGKFNGQQVDGNTAAKHLYQDIHLWYQSQQMKSPNSAFMEVYNDVTGEAWQVEPYNTPQFTRTSQAPIELMFSMDFIILKDMASGSSVAKVADDVVSTFSSTTSITQYTVAKVATASASASSVKQTPPTKRVVQTGETLWTIAQSYLPKQVDPSVVQTFVDEIASFNNIANENSIFPGMTLSIPA